MELLRKGVKVDYLDIVLENCEVMRVPTQSIKHFEMSTKDREERHSEYDNVAELITKLEIGIVPRGIKEVCFGLLSSYGCLNRIWNRKDITQISFITKYINEDRFDEETLYVEWSNEGFDENTGQTSYLDNEDNSLEVCITQREEKQIEQHQIHLEKELILQYIKETKNNILKKDKKSACDIGGLNMLERVSIDIKSGKFDKVVF